VSQQVFVIKLHQTDGFYKVFHWHYQQ